MMKLVFVALLLILPQVSIAARGEGVLLSFSGFLCNQTRESGTSSADDNLYIYDLKLGYSMGSGLYAGAIHSTRSRNGSAISGESGSATGASLGYQGDSGLYLMGHYYLTGKFGDYNEASGVQADFGYLTQVSGPFSVGVELSYRNIEYKKDGAANLRVKELFPMLTAAFTF